MKFFINSFKNRKPADTIRILVVSAMIVGISMLNIGDYYYLLKSSLVFTLSEHFPLVERSFCEQTASVLALLYYVFVAIVVFVLCLFYALYDNDDNERSLGVNKNMKKIIPSEDIKKLYDANETAPKYSNMCSKYSMCYEWKFKKDGKWTSWKFIGHDVPSRYNIQYSLKSFKGITYLISEEYTDCFGYICVDRYQLNDAVKQLLDL